MDFAAYHFDPNPSARGAQGEVYYGTRIADGAAVAMKVASGGRGSVKALEQEIAVLQLLGQAGVGGVVPCIDVVSYAERPAMVMPLFPTHLGDWLNTAVVSPGPTTLREALRYCSSVSYTLGRVHQTPWQGGTLVHRDIKPENIFLDAQGAPFVGDFGGAMAIDGLMRVELTLFGTPMWAPLDQILPGQAIPDPTWDTYALCVFLYAAITGARPAYQSDPRTLLTPMGRDMWEVARKAIEGPEQERAQWAKHFAKIRTGARAPDLVDVTGHGALVDADRAAIEVGLARLCQLAGLPERSRRSISRSMWDLLVRGLSPVSHPSPPNRFRDGIELGELLDEIRDRVRSPTPAPAPARPNPGPTLRMAPVGAPLHEAPPSSLRAGPSPVWLLLLLAAGIAATAGGAYVYREPLLLALGPLLSAPDRIPIAGTALEIGRLETTVAQWKACAGAGACPEVYQRLEDPYPAIGLSLEDAAAYCAFAGGRLPTEAEWTAAAGEGPMPWGDKAATCDRAVALGCGDDLQPVGSARGGRTAAGVEDLAGNAWEWVRTEDGGALMGGDHHSPVKQLGRNGRLAPDGGAASPTAGVRCVWTAPTGSTPRGPNG